MLPRIRRTTSFQRLLQFRETNENPRRNSPNSSIFPRKPDHAKPLAFSSTTRHCPHDLISVCSLSSMTLTISLLLFFRVSLKVPKRPVVATSRDPTFRSAFPTARPRYSPSNPLGRLKFVKN